MGGISVSHMRTFGCEDFKGFWLCTGQTAKHFISPHFVIFGFPFIEEGGSDEECNSF